MWQPSIAARPILERAVALGRPLRKSLGDLWLVSLNSLTIAYITQLDHDLAQGTYGELIDLMRERGMGGTTMVVQLQRYGGWLASIDKHQAAEAALVEAVEVARRELPVGHELREAAHRGLGGFLDGQNRHSDVEALFARWAEEIKTAHGDLSDSYWKALGTYQGWLRKQGREEDATRVEDQLRVLREKREKRSS